MNLLSFLCSSIDLIPQLASLCPGVQPAFKVPLRWNKTLRPGFIMPVWIEDNDREVVRHAVYAAVNCASPMTDRQQTLRPFPVQVIRISGRIEPVRINCVVALIVGRSRYQSDKAVTRPKPPFPIRS